MLRTFGEKTAVAIDHVLAQKPSIAEFIVSFYQLDPVTLCQT